MQDNNQHEFIASMKVMSDLYQKPPLSKEALKVFFDLLKDFSIKQVQEALQKHLSESDFMPRPADILRILKGSKEDRATLAWAFVVKTMRKYGRRYGLRFPSPAYHFAIINMGGWINLCSKLTEAELPYREKDFIRFFEIGSHVATWEPEPGKFMVAPFLQGENGKALYAETGEPFYPASQLVDTGDNSRVKKLIDGLVRQI